MSRPRRVPAAVAAVLGATALAWATGGAAALAATVDVGVLDHEYAPAAIEIVAGDTVRWTWKGEAPHSVTSPGVFDSHPDCSLVNPEGCGTRGTTFEWTSSQPTTIEYSCRVHPDRMRGTITVTPAPAESPPPPAPPSPSPSPSPAPAPSPSPKQPAPSPTAAPAPSAASPSPSPRPTRRSAPSLGFGEATEVPGSPSPTEGGGTAVAPPVVSDTSPEPLEPFPAAPSPDASPDPVADDVVAVGPPGGSDRTAVRLAGAAAVALSLIAFGRVVLFGRPWE
ncbi:MAG: hypothetical protein KY457_01165 [Actinobacteria bacterium]|nr:hypothetical protein [Actinomycetota bacterium]